MSPVMKRIHRGLLSLAFSVLNWSVIKTFLVELPFWKYIIIELFLVISMKFYIFTIRKFKL
mgnify:CR=1 FL=1